MKIFRFSFFNLFFLFAVRFTLISQKRVSKAVRIFKFQVKESENLKKFVIVVQGLETIRAMRAGSRFQRDFLVKLEESTRAQLTASAAQQWLGLRLQMLGAFLIGGSGFIAVITSADSTTPELTGLVISYTLSFVTLLSGVLNALTETEQVKHAWITFLGFLYANKMCHKILNTGTNCRWACQRLQQSKARSECRWFQRSSVWLAMPRCYQIRKCFLEIQVNLRNRRTGRRMMAEEITNLFLLNRPYLQTSLRNINFQTSSCERIGVVGRTGAGKSSLMAALLRIAPLSTGHIYIDTVDISTLPLATLRSRIALVPQDSFLFSGTIRDNLDPRGLHLGICVFQQLWRKRIFFNWRIFL